MSGRLTFVFAVAAIGAFVAGSAGAASTPFGRTATATATAAAQPSAPVLSSPDLSRVERIKTEVTARYRGAHRPNLTVTEASSTAAFESFALLSGDLVEMRVVPAKNGVYFATCPRRATCPYPSTRSARSPKAFAPRRQALELAVRTFAETSADVVAVSLPTANFVLFIVERTELEKGAGLDRLGAMLSVDPGVAPEAGLRRVVDRVTYPRLYVPLGLERTPTGGTTYTAMPLWPRLR
jgi:hypothetical protein